VCDEETGGENGILHLLADDLLTPCDCLIAEPTPARHPCIGQKGLCRLEMKFSGVPAHGSLYPAVGVSAIMEAISLLEYVKDQHTHQYTVDESLQDIIDRSSAVLGREFTLPGVSEILKKLTYNPGMIRGGEKSNVVAQYCYLDLELRIPWGCSIQDLLSGIRSHAKNCTIISQTIHDPSITGPLCPLVSITCDEVKKVYGGTVFPIVQWAASDARHLRKAGFRVIEYGPGEISSLHAVNERISIGALEKTALVFQGIMCRYREPVENKS
jgi:succinyl-diaminopimelate desuccinylase